MIEIQYVPIEKAIRIGAVQFDHHDTIIEVSFKMLLKTMFNELAILFKLKLNECLLIS